MAQARTIPEHGTESLGERIARLRKARKLSQTEVAEKLGTSQKVLSDYELNKLRPHYEMIIHLARAFGVTTDELLGVKESPPAPPTPNKKLLKRMEKIDTLPESQQKFLLRAIDSHLKALEQE